MAANIVTATPTKLPTGIHLMEASWCSYPPQVNGCDVLKVDFDCHDILMDGLYLIHFLDESGQVNGCGCRRFAIPLLGGIQVDEDGNGRWKVLDGTERMEIVGRVLQVFRPAS